MRRANSSQMGDLVAVVRRPVHPPRIRKCVKRGADRAVADRVYVNGEVGCIRRCRRLWLMHPAIEPQPVVERPEAPARFASPYIRLVDGVLLNNSPSYSGSDR